MDGQEKQEETLKLKISKKAYVFDVRKKYAVNRNFLLKKKPENPAEDFKEQLQSFFKKKPGPAEPSRGLPKPDKKSTMTAVLTVAAVILLFVLLGSAYVLLRVSTPAGGTTALPNQASFIGDYQFSVREADLLSAVDNDVMKRQAYALLDYSGERLLGMNFTLKLYSQRPTTQIFLLEYARDSADNYPVFRKRLLDGLAERQMPVSEIGIDKIASLPAGSTLIVPTGYMPKEMLRMDSAFDYLTILKRGSSIIYIGLEMTRVLDASGSTISASPSDLQFKEAELQSTDGFNLFDGQYVVTPRPRSGFTSSSMLYNSVSMLCYGKGCIMFLPQNLDGGWRGSEQFSPGEVAANDVLRMIDDEKWLPALAVSSVAAQSPEGAQTATVLSSPIPGDSVYAILSAQATDLQGASSRSMDVFRIEKTAKGEIESRESYAVPYYLSGQLTRLGIQLKEPSPAPVKLYVRVYKDGAVLQDEELELGLTVPDKEKSKDIQMDMGPGSYIIKVTDKEGKSYAATAIEVINPTVVLNGSPQWDKRTFAFYLTAQGEHLTPRAISVSLDGRYEKRYNPTTYVYSGGKPYIIYEYPEQIQPGVHQFSFSSGSWSSTLSEEYRQQRYPWDNPLVLVLGVVSIIVFGIGLALKRPEVLRYGLDIPDFPPHSTIKIPVKRETVLQIFNDVNSDFSWQWMPLRTEEIKNGFRRLTYNGKPILVGDFNLERLLFKLKEEGLVKEEIGYWGRTDWEKAANHSIKYLTVYRILRNVFVNNAVKFSKLDAVSDCDVKAIVGKEEKYFHVMDGSPEKIAHRALATARRGTTIIVFSTDEERSSFTAMLSSTSKLAVALKMEMQNGNLMLLPVKNAVSAYLKSISN